MGLQFGCLRLAIAGMIALVVGFDLRGFMFGVGEISGLDGLQFWCCMALVCVWCLVLLWFVLIWLLRWFGVLAVLVVGWVIGALGFCFM